MDSISMWFLMAFLTTWDLTMSNMAACTLQGCMLGRVRLQLIVYLGMASCTDSV